MHVVNIFYVIFVSCFIPVQKIEGRIQDCLQYYSIDF
jgi:hypothetical protein